MEPFISPDGNYLFFNNSNSLPTDQSVLRDAHRRRHVPIPGRDCRCQRGPDAQRGPLDGHQQHFLFRLDQELLADSFHDLLGYIFQRQPLERRDCAGSFEREIRRHEFRPMHQSRRQHVVLRGRRLHRWAAVRSAATIAIAKRNGNQFTRLKNSAKIMRKINTHDLNYAPDVSKSGLEFFWTRIPIRGSQPKPPPVIYTATRSSRHEPFRQAAKD